jgi:alanine racemase
MPRAWAEVSLGAIAANVEALRRAAAPAQVCAVV